MKANIIILNSKERKLLRQQLFSEFGIDHMFEDTIPFCINKKERVYIANRQIFEYDQDSLRVNAFGLYIGTYMPDGFRLSLEGAQLLGPLAKKNILDINLNQRNAWFKGQDLDYSKDAGEYVILRCAGDFLGCGKLKNKRIMNYLSKARKLTNVFEEKTSIEQA